MHSFYSTISRDSPSQMDLKLLKGNEYYYESINPEKEGFEDKKRRDDMKLQRITEILNRKRLPDINQEMCYQKYVSRLSQKL